MLLRERRRSSGQNGVGFGIGIGIGIVIGGGTGGIGIAVAFGKGALLGTGILLKSGARLVLRTGRLNFIASWSSSCSTRCEK